jgi:hypothetical protein
MVAEAATALAELLDNTNSPLWGWADLSVDAQLDIKRRAYGIASDVDGDTIIDLSEVPQLVKDADELQRLVAFFLAANESAAA